MDEGTRKEVSRVLRERVDAIVSDSAGLFHHSGPQSLEIDYCERLGRRLLGLMTAGVDGHLPGETDGFGGLLRLVVDRGLALPRLFNFVYLMERTILDEVALDASVGAASESWPLVAEIIRRSSFDLLALYCERAQQDSTSPAISDRLTTLYSRAMMDVVLSTEVQRAERFSFPIALLLFDVDHLSALNQSHGYGVGDRLLERLGILIRTFFRQNDWVFRRSGDSIAVLLCQVGAEEALVLASRAVAMVEQRLDFKDHATEDRVRVTVSAAVITGQGSLGDPFDAERLLLEADAAMTRAKSLGRNRVEATALAPGSLSVQTAARYLQCSPEVVERLISEGKLQTTGAGETRRIAKLAVEDYRNAKALDIKSRPPNRPA
jgi:diguanylate cyclase (GGDEF)-like protein/excisionase family DNA binding protein